MSRTTARTAAMQLVYERISGGQGGEDTLKMVYEELRRDGVPGVEDVGINEPNESDREFIASVLEGVIQNRDIIDQLISGAAQGWTIDRMPVIDLTIMRIAVWEMLFKPDIPGNVSISEALELTDRYSDPDDKKFVNGVLGTILRELNSDK